MAAIMRSKAGERKSRISETSRPERLAVLARVPWSIASSLVMLTVLGLVAIFAPVVAPHDPLKQDLLMRLDGPSATHWFGTDGLGRDVFSRTIYGLRVSLGVALFGTTIGMAFGTLLGLVSGYIGGRPDYAIMFLVDAQQAMPFIIVCLVVIAVVGASVPTLLGLVSLAGWETYTRFARGSTLVAREGQYVLAARAGGCSFMRTLFRHVLPNVVSPLIVIATLNISSIILLESALSFLGIGVQPPTPSWGQMIAESRQFLNTAWWATAGPAAGMVLLTLAVSLTGDWLRDVMDPATRRR